MEVDILKVIQSIRDSFIGAEHVYKNGSCWYFANILRTIFPEGEIYENIEHAVFKYKGKFYDIGGEVSPQTRWEKAEEPTLHGKFDLIYLLRYPGK